MQNRKALNQFLKEYDDHAGLRRAFFPLPWVQELRYFIKNLKNDESITQSEKETLETIINSRDMNDIHSDSQLSESEELARKILNVLSVPILDENIKADFDFTTLVKIFNYLRPDEIVPLLRLSKEFNRELHNPLIWREALSGHFIEEFLQHKHKSNVNWFHLFKLYYPTRYHGLSERMKQLFSSVILGDVLALNALNMNFEDLYLQDMSEDLLITFAAQSPSQSFRNHIYHTFIRPFYLKNVQDKLGFTLLHQAAAFNQVEVVIILLNSGANVDALCNDARTPLWIAARYGHLDVVRKLLARGGNVNTECRDGRTPLWIAARYGHLDVVRELFARGANVDAACNGGRTPLEIAACNGHHDVVSVLLSNGANVDAENHCGVTPLWSAAYYGHLDVVKKLLVNRANVSANHHYGRTPLWVAASNGHLDVVIELLVNGANVNAECRDGRTPLWIAVSNGHLDVVRELLAKGANVDAENNDRITPLDIATQNGHTEVVKILYRSKLDIVINDIWNSHVSNYPATFSGRLFSREYSSHEKKAAAIALKLATDLGDMGLLNEYRQIIECTAELAPLYRNLLK